MTEEEAKAEVVRLAEHAMPVLERFVDLVITENAEQNLISRASIGTIWSRHVLDSLQLVAFARDTDESWIDIGSGGGFPGIVVAAMQLWQVTLVEPRKRRAEFLMKVCAELGLTEVTVVQSNAQAVTGAFDIVSARAVGSIGDLIAMSAGFRKPSTLFVLPRGERAADDVEIARHDWHGMFHVEQSRTNPASGIVLIDRVSPR